MRIYTVQALVAILVACYGTTTAAIQPAALGDAIANAGTGLSTVKGTEAWRRLSSTVRGSVALRATLRRLQGGATRAAHLVHGLVDRLRVGGGPIVKTRLGSLRGRYLMASTASRMKFYSFRGIRYAQPSVGKLRFRAPQPVEPWRGIRDAVEEGAVCPHRFILFDNYKGDEDCLFLNVYSPTLADKLTGYNPKLPVMVWIHGGAFMTGSGNAFLYGPDYLVDSGVVLVTLNYRLGALGFLSLDDEVQGDAGLRDQRLALQWVQNNIEFFGGDPSSVTIFGESAGAASVQYHMLSPESKGLFHRAISQSGSVLSPWASVHDPRQRAMDLGRTLGIETNTTTELLGFLRATPAETLVAAAAKLLSTQALAAGVELPFAPAQGRGQDPHQALLQGNFDPAIPFMTGFNSGEGILLFRRIRKNPHLLEEFERDLWRVVPPDLRAKGAERRDVAQRIRSFYFKNQTISMDNVDRLVELLTDILFVRPTLEGVRLQKRAQPQQAVFMYRFSFDGALGLYKRLLGITRPGVAHGDELGYLFHFGNFNFRLDEDTQELHVLKRMVNMWTDFAKTGNPTPTIAGDVPDFIWKPVSSANLTGVNYLNVDGNFKMKISPESERMKFWDEIYSQYNGDKWGK